MIALMTDTRVNGVLKPNGVFTIGGRGDAESVVAVKCAFTSGAKASVRNVVAQKFVRIIV